ncbi:MAG: carboxypeptidase regulatory-like domain-containing protein [Candidatus Pacebacteria bacterium]|nr:carboxypeptidase regulatory-like domain-containing protein [Candidatus Paceibacterota bacterium]
MSKKYLIIISLLTLVPLGLIAQTSDSVNVGLEVAPDNDPGGGGGGETLIGGWVYEDADANGSKGSSEGWLAGWTINLYKDGTIVRTLQSSDEKGLFYFLDLDPGIYQVCEDLIDPDEWVQTDPNATGGSSWRAGDRVLCPNGTWGYETEIEDGEEAYSFTFGNFGGAIGGVPNVINFTATPATTVINLNWQNPNYLPLQAVRIVRLIGGVPADPNDGELVYEGTGESAVDSNVVPGVTYTYAAFVRNTSNQYSSGAIASAMISVGDDEDPPECETEPCDDLPPGDDNVFDNYPTAIDNSLPSPTLIFIQPSHGAQSLSASGSVEIDGAEELTVFLPVGAVPEGLKTIGLTLFAPNSNRSFSFILRLNDERTGYTATLAPLGESGRYNFTLHIINYKNQQIQRVNGTLVVSASIGQLPIPEGLDNVAVGLGVAVGLTQLLLVATQAKSLTDIYLIILRALSALFGYTGLKRRYQPWGTVYDAITKRPIDPAVVTLMQGDKEVSTAITDIDGRYGFFLPPGNYHLKAGKTHYLFPSKILAGQESDPLYNNLYFGQAITTEKAGEIVARNIPLDPIDFDWNEFVKNKGQYFKLATRRRRVQAIIFNGLYLLGFVIAVFHTLTSPSTTDFVILAAYLAIYAGQKFWKYRYPVLSLKRQGGEPLSYSVIKVFLAGLNQEVKRVITNELGQFYLLLRPGEYYFVIEEKLPDASYREVHRSSPQVLKTGVLQKDLIIP